MKKFLIIALAAVFCTAFALPAMAQVKVGGTVTTDFYHWSADSNSQAGPINNMTGNSVLGVVPSLQADDRDELQFNPPEALNEIRITYANKAKTYGAMVIFESGGRNGYFTDFGHSNTTGWDRAHMWWQILPNVKLTIGHGGVAIKGGVVGHPQLMGQSHTSIVSLAYGNSHDAAGTGIKADIKINDMVSLQLGMYDPEDSGAGRLSAGLTSATGPTATMENRVPRFDIGVPIKFGNFFIHPVAFWHKWSYEQVTPGADDSYTSWSMSIEGTAKFGPLTLQGEITSGENLDNGRMMGADSFAGAMTALGGQASVWADAAGTLHISDVDHFLWWVSGSYSVTPQFSVQAWYGTSEFEDGKNPLMTTDDFYGETGCYGLRLTYAVAANFFIFPHYVVFDRGNDWRFSIDGSDATYTMGKNTIVGVEFMMVF